VAELVERQQEEGLGREGRVSARPGRLTCPCHGRRGRAPGFSLGLLIGFLLLGYAGVRALELLPRGGGATRNGAAPEHAAGLETFAARVPLGAASVVARLMPLHDEPALEEFRARALRERYGLPEGRPWRLYLALEAPVEPAEPGEDPGAAPAPLVVLDARVGSALVPFAELARTPDGPDPVHALLAAAPAALAVDLARPMVLWGHVPDGAELSLDGAELELASADARGSAPLERMDAFAAPRWYAGVRDLPAPQPNGLAAEVARLERELERERARRVEREAAFLEFNRLLAQLPAAKALLTPAELDELGLAVTEPTPEELAALEAERAARARAEELGQKLTVLMRLEGVRGLDLMDAGTLQPPPPAEPRGIGPVVFRCLDERGRLTGSLSAARLRLEGSLAAHTLTFVLEDGFESRGGERTPFLDGERRIPLTEVDPEPWMRECPELFDPADRVRANDDGLWSLTDVRRELNRLLALDTHLGWYRLHSLGGVLGRELVDVQLEEMESSGRLARRLFADRLALVLEDASVVLELADGASVRGGEKTPFRDGRHRIVLPGVPLDAWRAARLPGLAEPPPRGADGANAAGASAPDERAASRPGG
jgi:hypothetical protein